MARRSQVIRHDTATEILRTGRRHPNGWTGSLVGNSAVIGHALRPVVLRIRLSTDLPFHTRSMLRFQWPLQARMKQTVKCCSGNVNRFTGWACSGGRRASLEWFRLRRILVRQNMARRLNCKAPTPTRSRDAFCREKIGVFCRKTPTGERALQVPRIVTK